MKEEIKEALALEITKVIIANKDPLKMTSKVLNSGLIHLRRH